MNSYNFAEWFRRRGHTVICTESCCWVDFGPRVYQSFPYHIVIEPSENELIEFLINNRAICLRYSTPVNTLEGKLSYHVIYQGRTYEVTNLPKKARYDIHKGLEYATYERISLKRLSSEGWAVREDTLIRQGRKGAETQDWWVKLCLSAEDLPGFEAWGVIRNGRLLAGLLAFVCDNCFYILYQQSLSEHLKYGINNALAYIVTHEAMKRPGISQVFYGLHSLDAPASVDEFKFRMGYIAKPVRQRIVFHPWIAPLFNSATYNMIKVVANWKSANLTLAKTEGLIRFYQEGKLPLEKQIHPEEL